MPSTPAVGARAHASAGKAHPGRRHQRTRALTGAVALLAASPLFATLTGVAGADQVADLKSQAIQVAQQLTEEQLAVGGYQQQYEADAEAQQRGEAAIAGLNQQITLTRQRIVSSQTQLASEAVKAYMDAGQDTSGISELFSTDQNSALASSVYRESAIGDIAVTIDQLRTSQRALATDQSALQAQEAADAAATSHQATLLSQSQATQTAIEQHQSEISGALSAAVAAEQAAQAATAAAALKAAQAKAATTTTSTSASSVGNAASGATTSTSSSSSSGGGGGGGATSDPALNPFLVCVVAHESGGNYAAVSPDGLYMGAFQFSQGTWNDAAQLAGLPGLIGVAPNTASKASQDTLAVALYAADGSQPWYDPCTGS